MKTINEALKNQIEKSGISQKELAESTGLKAPYLSKMIKDGSLSLTKFAYILTHLKLSSECIDSLVLKYLHINLKVLNAKKHVIKHKN